MKFFCQSILSKIANIVTTRRRILSQKCTNSNFAGLRPEPTGKDYRATPDPRAGFKRPTSKGQGTRGGMGEDGKGGRLPPHPYKILNTPLN